MASENTSLMLAHNGSVQFPTFDSSEYTPEQLQILEAYWSKCVSDFESSNSFQNGAAFFTPLVPDQLVLDVFQCLPEKIWLQKWRVQRWVHCRVVSTNPVVNLGHLFWRSPEGWNVREPPSDCFPVEDRGITVRALNGLFVFTGYWSFEMNSTRVRDVVPQLVAWSADYKTSVIELTRRLWRGNSQDRSPSQFMRKPDAFVSYGWNMGWHEVVSAMMMYAGDDKDMSFWFDVVCINQHQELTAVDLSRLDASIQKAGTTVVFIDNAASASSRVWCLYEILVTLRHGCNLTTMFTSPIRSHVPVYAVLTLAGRFNGVIDVEHNAVATFEEDRVRILHQIQNLIGFQQANKAIEEALLQGARQFLKEISPRGLLRKPLIREDGRKSMLGFSEEEVDEMVAHAQELGVTEIVRADGSMNTEKFESLEKVVRGNLMQQFLR